ncbi:MAG TPA: nitrous oxide reductase family maturation protein NosD [Kofleriaceae bacterium]|nr:nitrous oxide reductase family maturation protein NosD [Kofleriaceae bacterium]
MRALLLLALVGCGRAEGHAVADEPPVPPRPASCRDLGPADALQPVLDGTDRAICLAPGRYAGPIRIARTVTLWGPREAVIAASSGTVVSITGEGAALQGVTIDGTGGVFDRLDAAVAVTGRDIRVEGIAITNAVYGILVDKSERVTVAGNHIHGDREAALGMRGDTIRLWETRDSVVTDNIVEDGRDVVIWYSRGNRIERNRIVRGRYGAHFMYSHDNIVRGNELRGGVVGIFAMYSRGLVIERNVIVDAAGAAGMGIGLKESGNLTLEHNILVHDSVGIYIDSSPLQLGDTLTIRNNVLRLDRAGIVFHASGHRITISGNDFADNDQQVRVDGGGNAVDVDWHDNYFDDYTGYDLDGDDIGDVRYELRSVTGQLIGEHTDLALFRGTPALGLVDAAAHLDPLFQPQLVLADPRPRMTASVEVP